MLDAKTPRAVVGVEGEDARVDARCVIQAFFLHFPLPAYGRMLKDDRVKEDRNKSVFTQEDEADRLG